MIRLLSFGLLLGLGLVVTPTFASEQDQSRVSKSSGFFKSPSEDMAHFRQAPEIQRHPKLITEGVRKKRSGPKSMGKSDQVFWIYDAYAFLNFDEDGDGFHHNFSVVFDADVDHGLGFVYADLYLSLDGGPWNHYFTTEIFSIEGSSSLDEYEVTSELNTGYPTGYYDVLIELVDADTEELVAVADPADFAGISALPLEDSDRDFSSVTVVSVGHGGGSIGWVLLLVLLIGGTHQRWKSNPLH